MYRRAADLCARADRAAAARAWLTYEPSAVRVGDGGGGRRGGPSPTRLEIRIGVQTWPGSLVNRPTRRGSRVGHATRPGSRIGRVRCVERCLAQRRELECRSHSTAHQLAKRALVRATCRQHGEHVFGKVGAGSDGIVAARPRFASRFGSATGKNCPRIATDLARGHRMRQVPRNLDRGHVAYHGRRQAPHSDGTPATGAPPVPRATARPPRALRPLPRATARPRWAPRPLPRIACAP